MGTTIPIKTLSTRVVVELVRDGLISAIGTDLTDPKAGDRPAKSPLVMTSFPSRNPFFPVIVVEELNAPGGHIDRQVDLHRTKYAVQLLIHSESKTDLYKLRDEVRAWILGQLRAFAAAGWVDVQIVSSTKADWDVTARTHAWQITVQGDAYTNT